MFINRIKKAGGGSANIEDYIALNSVKFFFPFIDSIENKSLYSYVLTNVSNGSLVATGFEYKGTGNIRIPYSITIDEIFTFEFILENFTSDSTSRFILSPNGSGGLNIYTLNNQIRIGSYSIADWIIFDITPYKNKRTHFAVTYNNNEVKLYVDGVLKSTANGKSTQPSIYTFLGHAFIGIVCGYKFTQKILEPSQFSLTRPMELKYPSFVVGEKEYIYNGGVFNPKYQPTVNNFTNIGGKLINGSQLSIPYAIANKKCFVEGTILSAIGSYKQIYLYYSTTTSLPNNYGKNTIYYPNADGYPFSFGFSLDSDIFISLTCNQSVLEITKIWIE